MIFYVLYLKSEKDSPPGGDTLENNIDLMTFHVFIKNLKNGNNISAAGAFWKINIQQVMLFMKHVLYEKCVCFDMFYKLGVVFIRSRLFKHHHIELYSQILKIDF